MMEFECEKCGNTFYDNSDPDLSTPEVSRQKHFRNVDNDGVDHGECGGIGNETFDFGENFSNRGSLSHYSVMLDDGIPGDDPFYDESYYIQEEKR